MLAIEGTLNLLLFVAALGLEVFALIDAVTRPGRAFQAADKLTKPAWLLILALAVITCILFKPLGILGLLGVVAAGVYLADVRPALRGMS